jgi:hypothetical protein
VYNEKRPRKPQWLGGFRGLFPFSVKSVILKKMLHSNRRMILLTSLMLLGLGLTGCSGSEDSGKLGTPITVFDKAVPDPRTDTMKINDFIVGLERKYRREDSKNSIDLHFKENGPGRIKVKLTYDREADPTLVSSIADAAIEHAKRLKREDPSVRDVTIVFEREVSRREE